MTAHEPATTLWDLVELDLEPLEPDDPRVVDTSAARGDFSRAGILRQLGVDPRARTIHKAPRRCYALLSGHRGCGKSTELRRLARDLHSPGGYWVVFVDALETLDPNNLQYPDVFLALAGELVRGLQERELEIDDVHFERLEQWFSSRIESHTKTKELTAEIKAGAKVEAGLPWLGKLFAACTNAFRTNSTYKTELRKVVQNSFSEFAQAFDLFIKAAEDALARGSFHGRVLFVVDGLDRLGTEDAQRFFVTDVHQLQQVDGVFLYVAPIHMLYSSNAVNQAFETFKLPMIKLAEKGSDKRIEAAYSALRAVVHRRASAELFDGHDVVDELITASGGHPRDLIRLLKYAYQNASGETIGHDAVTAAIGSLASDYKRMLHASDYAVLRSIDAAPCREEPSDERVHELLHNLVVLEYNDYWWQTHPVVRTLPGYAASNESMGG
ncbi:MAG: hypothetical protein AB1Z98_34745 [Nannocystaceae bacterium]